MKNFAIVCIFAVFSVFCIFASGASEQHWRETLASDVASAYDKIRDAVFLMEKNTYIGHVSASEVDGIYQAVLNDHPNLFWIRGFEYQPASGIMSFDYLTDKAGRKIMQDEITRAVSDIPGTSVFEIVSWFENACIYDSRNLDQTLYSALVRRSGVCASYAKAFQYVALLRGIDCVTVSGASGEFGIPHDYNIVYSPDGTRSAVDISPVLEHSSN